MSKDLAVFIIEDFPGRERKQATIDFEEAVERLYNLGVSLEMYSDNRWDLIDKKRGSHLLRLNYGKVGEGVISRGGIEIRFAIGVYNPEVQTQVDKIEEYKGNPMHPGEPIPDSILD